MKTLDDLIRNKKIVVCVGSGGVGKTTMAASIALHCAMAGRKTLALTIDPAKRLANSLGLASLGNEETLIPKEKFEQAGLRPAGSLYAMMLDTKRGFDEIIGKIAPSEEVVEKILANTIYQNLSTAMAGSHEYVAMQKFYELYIQGRYDVIVLDTPPTKQALDFLDAPGRLSDFLDRDVLKWFLKPYLSAGRAGMKALNRTGAVFFKLLERVTGIEFLKDLSDFFLGFNDIFDEFKKGADTVFDVLRSEKALFLLVTSPGRMPIEEARFFYDKLRQNGMPFGGFIINRIHRDLLTGEPKAPATDSLEGKARREFGDFAGVLMENFRNVQILAEIDETRVAEFVGSLDQEAPYWAIPFFDEDVFDLTGLDKVGRYLFSGTLRNRDIETDPSSFHSSG